MSHQATNAPTPNEPEDATLRRAATKDLSLVSLVPRRSGGETTPPIGEFLETIESSAAIGNWSETDRKQKCALKLTDAARAFYSATPDLRDPAITWQYFKTKRTRRSTVPIKPLVNADSHICSACSLYTLQSRIGKTRYRFSRQ